MTPLRIAICEDHRADALRLQSLIEVIGTPAQITCYSSGGAFLASMPAGRFDLVFLDIYMHGISGVEAARILREADEDCGLVFTTSSPDHMPEALDVGAEQYLVKPVNADKLMRVLEKRSATVWRRRNDQLLRVRDLEIPLDNICFVEVFGHSCMVHTIGGTIETGSSMTIDEFEAKLPPPRFFRCHKSFIVNFAYVQRIERDFIMKDGSIVYIRRGDVARCGRELDKWRLYEAGRQEE